MSENSDRVARIVDKLAHLQDQITRLKTENQSLKDQNVVLKRELEDKTQKEISLQEDYKRIKLAKTLVSNTGDKAEMKFRVNELVREIDKCIALLNR
jgi:chromosome segregation ATPase